MANLLLLHLSSPSSSPASPCSCLLRSRSRVGNIERLLWRDILSRDCYACRAVGGEKFRFRPEEELRRRGGFDPSQFGKSERKRIRWSDYDDEDDDDDDDDYDWEDDEDGELMSMVFEAFRVFSWMLVPIGISLLLGTDINTNTNTTVPSMAIAVPFVQSILSFVIGKVWSNRPGTRRRRTFFRSETANYPRSGRNNARQDENTNGYKSWATGDADSNRNDPRYGGWDDLDARKESRHDHETWCSDNVESPKQQNQRRMNRRPWRQKERPLLLRMMIAVFPFLGSWTKLFF